MVKNEEEEEEEEEELIGKHDICSGSDFTFMKMGPQIQPFSKFVYSFFQKKNWFTFKSR